jgi:hypothetical protein
MPHKRSFVLYPKYPTKSTLASRVHRVRKNSKPSVSTPHYIVKGLDAGGRQQQQQRVLGEEGDFAVHASVYGKVQVEPSSILMTKREGKGEEGASLLPSWAVLLPM